MLDRSDSQVGLSVVQQLNDFEGLIGMVSVGKVGGGVLTDLEGIMMVGDGTDDGPTQVRVADLERTDWLHSCHVHSKILCFLVNNRDFSLAAILHLSPPDLEAFTLRPRLFV